jgi:hypothetical protein
MDWNAARIGMSELKAVGAEAILGAGLYERKFVEPRWRRYE